MSAVSSDAEEVAVLVTSLFDAPATVQAAIESAHENMRFTTRDLQPENMNEADWDDVVKLVLSVSKVITV